LSPSGSRGRREYTTQENHEETASINLGTSIGIIGILASLVGIPIAFFLARRSRQLPDLRYVIDFDVILDPNDQLFGNGLSMSIGRHPISSISRSHVAVWNHRGDTIRKADIVDSDPLRLQFADGDIVLQTRALSMSRQQTKLDARINPDEGESVELKFDFLDAGDGSIFEIVHKGPGKPVMLGTIRGARIRNCGSVRLSPQNLAAFKKPALRSFLENAPLRAQINVLGNLLAGTASIVAVIILAVMSSKPVHLVNTKHYNLETVSGQAAFASRFTDLNLASGASAGLEVFLSLFALYCFWQIKKSSTWSRFPNSVLAFMVDENSETANIGNRPSP
jgi:hypothetical protein